MGILFDAVKFKAGKGVLVENGKEVLKFEVGIPITERRSIRYRPGIYMREEPARAVGRKEQSDHESQD